MTRLMVMTFWGKERFAETGGSHGHDHHGGTPHESPFSMVLPLIVLAVGAVLAGFAGIPEGLTGGRITNYFEKFLEPSIARPGSSSAELDRAGLFRTPLEPRSEESLKHGQAAQDHGTEWALMIVSSVIALAGIGIGLFWFGREPLWQPPKLLEDKYYVDEAYNAAIVQPLKVGSTNVLWKFIDVGIIDGAVNGAGYLAKWLGGLGSQLQSGLARSYVAMVVFGALLIIGYFVIK
jgi:NADH-quinone oxidoreductase subunit L